MNRLHPIKNAVARAHVALALFPLYVVVAVAALAFGPAPQDRAVDDGSLRYLGDALTQLEPNSAWQGVANDGTYFYLLTSQSTNTDVDSKENIIRKYRIADGKLVQRRYSTYTSRRAFSSGEVIDGKLYVAARDYGTHTTWARMLVYDATTLELMEEHDIETHEGYAVPEGVAKHDGSFWVIFSGDGDGSRNGNVCAIVQYDANWHEVGSYELFTVPAGKTHYGGQDIAWISNDEIVINLHEDGAPGDDKLDRYRWTGDGFVRTGRYLQLRDDETHAIGQGFTLLDGYLYLAARYSNRIVKAQLVGEDGALTPENVGDTDCDALVDARDAVLVLRLAASLADRVPCQTNADANESGHVSALDAAVLLQYAAGVLGRVPP